MNRWKQFSFVWLVILAAYFPLRGDAVSDIPENIVVMRHQLEKAKGRERVLLLSKLSEALLGRSVGESLDNAQRALDLARKLNDPGLEATALAQVGRAQCAGGNHRIALQTFQELLALQKNRKDEKGIAYALNRVGFALTDLSRYDEALSHYRDALKRARDIDDKKTIASTLNEMGVTYWYKGDVDSALPQFQEAHQMYARMGDEQNAAMADINIGLLFHEAGMLPDAISHYTESLKIFRELGLREGIGTAYINLCAAYKDQGLLPEALSSAKKALEELQATGDKQAVADANASIGSILFSQGKRDEVEPYLRRALDAYSSLGIQSGEADSLDQLGQLYVALGNKAGGKQLLKKAFEIYSGIKAKREAAKVSKRLSHIYEEDGDYEESLHYANQYLFYSEKSRESVEKLKLQYEKERLQNLKELTLREKKIGVLEAKRNRLIQFFLISFLGIVLLILWILYHSFKSKKNANELLNTLNLRLRIQSRTDTLTGLPNRRSMIDELEVECSRYDRNESDFTLLMVDIDDFKEINDTCGHEAGDEVLKAVSQVFQENVRQADSVCRWGGEEFLFLFRDTDIDGAVIVAEKILEEVAGTTVSMDESRLTVTVTIGVSSFANAGADITQAISRADQAMYDGKAAGKNRVCTASGRVSNV